MYFAGCFALLFFDFFLTLGDEIEFMWKGKKTASTFSLAYLILEISHLAIVFYTFLMVCWASFSPYRPPTVLPRTGIAPWPSV